MDKREKIIEAMKGLFISSEEANREIYNFCAVIGGKDTVADAILEALEEDEKPVIEWEKRLANIRSNSGLSHLRPHDWNLLVDFIRSEFQKKAAEIVSEIRHANRPDCEGVFDSIEEAIEKEIGGG